MWQSKFFTFMWKKRELSNGYVNHMMKTISSFFLYAIRNGYVDKKPKFDRLQTPKRNEKPYLRTEEVIKLFNNDKFDV